MRLTLRTLLAYIDDILEPQQAKEIGTKINESGFAATLMNRIRDVMRRRRLTAPDLEGPGSGLDPNMVAEYLDNVLAPEKVPDVEKVCLESDVHLAEVAACHQILTAALGEPVQILHESREHMYALGPAGKPATGQAAAASRPTNGSSPSTSATDSADQPIRSIAEKQTAETGTDFENSIPDFLRQRPLWKRALPYTVVGLVAAVWIGLLAFGGNWSFLDSTPNSSAQPADGDLNGQVAATLDNTEPAVDGIADSAVTDGTVEPEVAENPVNPFGGEPIDPEPPKDDAVGELPIVDAKPPGGLKLPETPGPDVPAPEDKPPAVAVVPKVAVAAPEPMPKPPAPNVAEPGIVAPLLKYNSPSGILLRYDDLVEDWMVMAPRAIVHPGERFAAPEPYDSVIDIGDGLARVTLIGGTSLNVLAPTRAAATGFGIQQGRVLLQPLKKTAANPADNDEAEQPIVLAIAVRDELRRVELLSHDTVCGIEVKSVPPTRPDQPVTNDSYQSKIFVVSGSIRLADGNGQVELLTGPSWRLLKSSAPAEGEEKVALGAAPPLLRIPDWLDPVSKESRARLVRRAATLFEREFDADRPLSENVHPLIKDDRPYISELAVKCLALTGKFSAVTEGLISIHEESRRAAIEGLRDWLATKAANGELLEKALQKRFPPEETVIVERLLWGYTDQDAMNRETSEQLVTWLDHESLAIRELAFYHVYHLTGAKYDYLPMRPATQRRAAIARWEERIKTEGALVAPAENQ